jgi:hypothetical protein
MKLILTSFGTEQTSASQRWLSAFYRMPPASFRQSTRHSCPTTN